MQRLLRIAHPREAGVGPGVGTRVGTGVAGGPPMRPGARRPGPGVVAGVGPGVARVGFGEGAKPPRGVGAGMGVLAGTTSPGVAPGVGGGPGSNTWPSMGAGGWTPGAGPGPDGGAAVFWEPSAGRSGAGECWAAATSGMRSDASAKKTVDPSRREAGAESTGHLRRRALEGACHDVGPMQGAGHRGRVYRTETATPFSKMTVLFAWL